MAPSLYAFVLQVSRRQQVRLGLLTLTLLPLSMVPLELQRRIVNLLVERGYDVVGVTLQLYDHGRASGRAGSCCAGQDIHDARAVADRLGIAHYVLDYEDRFREAVIDRFADSYLQGETPIPCVECNRSIKFRDLLATALDLGADVLATGHYVASRALPTGGRALHRALDPARPVAGVVAVRGRSDLARSAAQAAMNQYMRAGTLIAEAQVTYLDLGGKPGDVVGGRSPSEMVDKLLDEYMQVGFSARGGNNESIYASASGFDPVINAEKNRLMKVVQGVLAGV